MSSNCRGRKTAPKVKISRQHVDAVKETESHIRAESTVKNHNLILKAKQMQNVHHTLFIMFLS